MEEEKSPLNGLLVTRQQGSIRVVGHLLGQGMKEDLGCLVSSEALLRLTKQLIKSCTLALEGEKKKIIKLPE